MKLGRNGFGKQASGLEGDGDLSFRSAYDRFHA